MAQTLHPDTKGNLKYRFRIQRIGVEMEGAWNYKPEKRDPTTGLVTEMPVYPRNIKEDPSVRHFSRNIRWAAVGEVASQPLIRADLWKWMEDNKPDVVNNTCGLHIHMSFRHELDYQQLMDRSYHDHILLGLHKWGLKHVPAKHHFWPRLRGTNLFCQDVFHADFQVQYKGGGGGAFHDHRYGIVNFPHSQHKTVEIRVLPMFGDLRTGVVDIGLNMRAVRRVLNLTEEYLDAKGAKCDPARQLSVALPTVFDIPIRAVKEISPPGVGDPHIRFQAFRYVPNYRGAKSLLKTSEQKTLREVFYADPFFTAESVDPPQSEFPAWFPFDESRAAEYGVPMDALVEAFNMYAPFGGWTDYPNNSTRADILAQARALHRTRQQQEQAREQLAAVAEAQRRESANATMNRLWEATRRAVTQPEPAQAQDRLGNLVGSWLNDPASFTITPARGPEPPRPAAAVPEDRPILQNWDFVSVDESEE